MIRIIILLMLCAMLPAQPLVSNKPDSLIADSTRDSSFSAMPFNNLQLQMQIPDSLKVQFVAPSTPSKIPYYDPKNVIPDNPLELDYRESSYYTPRQVSDRLDQIMNRPRSDSFVPIPSLALLAASVALQMIHLDLSGKAGAVDYLQDQKDLLILKLLWQKSPQTVGELLNNPALAGKYTYQTLHTLLDQFSDLHLVKRKIIEAGETQYFPAQSRDEVVGSLRRARENPKLSQEEKTALIRVTEFISAE